MTQLRGAFVLLCTLGLSSPALAEKPPPHPTKAKKAAAKKDKKDKKASPASAKHGAAAEPAGATSASDEAELAPLVPQPPTTPGPAAVRTLIAYPDPPPTPPAVEAPAAPAPVAVAPVSRRWWVGALGGVSGPLSVLGVGGSFTAAVEYQVLAGAPLRAAFRVGVEQHTGQGSRLFLGAPQPRGYDAAATEVQTLVPFELGLSWEAYRHGPGALSLGAAYALGPVLTRTAVLGAVVQESGAGHALSLELGYAHRLGAFEVVVRARWGLRATAAGPRTAVLELPWYQAVSFSAGLGYCL